MMETIVRLESITIENFKNIVRGQLNFSNNRKPFRTSIMGLYGQKGITNTAAYGIGGKTSLLQPGDKVRYRARQFHT